MRWPIRRTEADGFHQLFHLIGGGSAVRRISDLGGEALQLRFVLDIAEFRRTGFRAEPLNLPCECEAPA